MQRPQLDRWACPYRVRGGFDLREQDDNATPIVLTHQCGSTIRQESAATPVRAHVLIVQESQVMVHPISWADFVVLSSFGILVPGSRQMNGLRTAAAVIRYGNRRAPTASRSWLEFQNDCTALGRTNRRNAIIGLVEIPRIRSAQSYTGDAQGGGSNVGQGHVLGRTGDSHLG